MEGTMRPVAMWIAVVLTVSGVGMLKVAESEAQVPSLQDLRTGWNDPDLQGIWDFRTVTPLERPEDYAEQEFLTPEELAAFRESQLQRRNADRRGANTASDLERGYNDFWWDYGRELTDDGRTSLIIDPPNGRMPAFTPAEAARVRQPRRGASRERIVLGVVPDGPENLGLAERCLLGFNSGPPMIPSNYNNNVQVFQSPGYVVLFNEMIHHTRVIPIDDRPHLPADIRQWAGDSRGTWDGKTLVVETTNFTAKSSFTGLAHLRGGSGRNLHLVERFTRAGRDRLLYEFTVTDSDAWTSPWTVAMPMMRTEDPTYEYACHEGNYAMHNILAGARAQEDENHE